MKTWVSDARQFAYLTWKQVEALPKKETLIILPTAAIEQHGHHLPLATDTLLAQFLLGKALELLPADFPAYVLPTVCYGKSNEHIGYPGTLSVSMSTFAAVIRDIAASLHAAGFPRFVLYNSHGGNSALLQVIARDLRAEFGLEVFYLSSGGGAKLGGLTPQEQEYGFHANHVETALMMTAMPELVHEDQYTASYVAEVNDGSMLRPENAPAVYAWLTRDVSVSGVMGDPNPATPEQGEEWTDVIAAQVAKVIREIAAFKYPTAK